MGAIRGSLLAATLLLLGASGGCLVGGPLFEKTAEKRLESRSQGPEVVRSRLLLAARWSDGERPSVELTARRERERAHEEYEVLDREVIYDYGTYSWLTDIVGELTWVNVYGPIVALVDMFRAPYYLARGELEVGLRAAGSLLYLLPGFQLAIDRDKGGSPWSPENGRIRYRYGPELLRTHIVSDTKEEAPAAGLPVEVLLGERVVARCQTDAEGRATLLPDDWDALVSGLAGGEERVLRFAAVEGRQRFEAELMVTDPQRRAVAAAAGR